MLRIVPADTKEAVNQARALFREYEASLGVDLCFQNFEKELEELPGEYAAPEGRLLLAFLEEASGASMGGRAAPGDLAGCIALRRFDRDICEMKRLYVRSQYRGKGIGRALALAVIAAAQEIGCRRICLDTLPQMDAAQALYHSLGFRDVPPYRFNPVPGARYLELTL